MPEPWKVVGIVGHIGPYDPKSMEWFTDKGRFTFYFQTNICIGAGLKWKTLFTLIGNTAYRRLADLHLPEDLLQSISTLITDLDSAYSKSVKTGISNSIPVYRSTRRSISRRVSRRPPSFINQLRFRRWTRQSSQRSVCSIRSNQIKKKLLDEN